VQEGQDSPVEEGGVDKLSRGVERIGDGQENAMGEEGEGKEQGGRTLKAPLPLHAYLSSPTRTLTARFKFCLSLHLPPTGLFGRALRPIQH
jgi:hypothetical protein